MLVGFHAEASADTKSSTAPPDQYRAFMTKCFRTPHKFHEIMDDLVWVCDLDRVTVYGTEARQLDAARSLMIWWGFVTDTIVAAPRRCFDDRQCFHVVPEVVSVDTKSDRV